MIIVASSVAAASASCPEPTGIEDILEALIGAEGALRGESDTLAESGRDLEQAVACHDERVPRRMRARLLRAIGASRLSSEERAAWWSAARSLEPGWTYASASMPSSLLEEWRRADRATWDHLDVATRLTRQDEPRALGKTGRGPIAHQYGVLPIPRIWGLVGYSTRGFEPSVGGSIGAGSTAVLFAEWTGGPETLGFIGLGTHSFIGDSYSHVNGGQPTLHCTVLHRHYVRPGLLVGVLREEGAYGFRVRPEVSLGWVGNLVATAPISWIDGDGWSVGLQVGAALGFP